MVVEREVQLDDVDAELAWELVTRPEDLEAWLGAEVDLDVAPGASGRVVDRDGTVRRIVVDEVDEGRRLTWRWWTEAPAGAGSENDRSQDDGSENDGAWDVSQVEISLTPTERGTVFRIVETPLVPTMTASAGAPGAWAGRLFDLQVLGLVATILIRA